MAAYFVPRAVLRQAPYRAVATGCLLFGSPAASVRPYRPHKPARNQSRYSLPLIPFGHFSRQASFGLAGRLADGLLQIEVHLQRASKKRRNERATFRPLPAKKPNQGWVVRLDHPFKR